MSYFEWSVFQFLAIGIFLGAYSASVSLIIVRCIEFNVLGDLVIGFISMIVLSLLNLVESFRHTFLNEKQTVKRQRAILVMSTISTIVNVGFGMLSDVLQPPSNFGENVNWVFYAAAVYQLGLIVTSIRISHLVGNEVELKHFG